MQILSGILLLLLNKRIVCVCERVCFAKKKWKCGRFNLIFCPVTFHMHMQYDNHKDLLASE